MKDQERPIKIRRQFGNEMVIQDLKTSKALALNMTEISYDNSVKYQRLKDGCESSKRLKEKLVPFVSTNSQT